MTDPRPETLDREAFRIAEKVLERHPASRAYHERMYGPQVGEPDEVILSRALLAAEQRAEEARKIVDELPQPRHERIPYGVRRVYEENSHRSGAFHAVSEQTIIALREALAPHKAAEEEE